VWLLLSCRKEWRFLVQKAHLYEAIFLVNQGIDQTVRGLARLKKAAGITEEIYGDTLAVLDHTRAQVNVQFLADMQVVERRDAERYERRENS
jgi:hypothetical protein